MSRPVKILTTAVVVVLVLAAVAGIAWWTVQSNPVAETGLFIDGKKVEEPPAMLTIGEHQVSFDVYRHYFLMYKGYFEEYYGAGFYDSDPDGDKVYGLKKMVEVELKNTYAWVDIAKEQGVELDEKDKEELEATLAEQKESFGPNFSQQLAEMNYLSEDNYRQVTELQALAAKARTAYQEEMEGSGNEKLAQEVDKEFLENNLRAKHILIGIDPEAADPAAAKAEAQLKAEAVLAEIRAGGSTEAAFDAAMNQYSEDPGLATNPDGYTFTEGQMVEIFYETTLSLEEGEISQPVLSESENYSGYHIILRLALDEEAMEENRTNAISAKVTAAVTEKEAQVEEAFTVTYPDFYNQFAVGDIR